MNTKKRIAVTGLGGFTGQYLKKAFESKGYEVFGLVRSESERVTPHDRICDITSREKVFDVVMDEDFDGLIHLAALSFVGHKDSLAFYAVNVLGTQNLLDALKESQKKFSKVILASSANVYGAIDTEAPVSEETLIAPVSHYAISKAAMEYVAALYYEDLPLLVTRPFNYTGPGQNMNFLIPKVVAHYREKKEEIQLGNLDIARDFSDVRDVASAYLNLYESDKSSMAVNICSGNVWSLQEIIRFMNGLAGYEMKCVTNPDFVRKNEIKALKGDNSRLLKIAKPGEFRDFKETLRDMFEYRG